MLNDVVFAPRFRTVTDETPWLNEEEMTIFRGFLEASNRITAHLSDALKARTGLTMDDYEVLVHLSEAEPSRLRMTDLSNRLLHSQSRLTQRVNRLAKQGLVVREPDPDDGRGTFAVLTDAGRNVLQAAAPGHLHDVRAVLMDHINAAERETLAEVLPRLAATARTAKAS